jgi:hypothetical protein
MKGENSAEVSGSDAVVLRSEKKMSLSLADDQVVMASMLAKRAQGRSHFGRLNWKQR